MKMLDGMISKFDKTALLLISKDELVRRDKVFRNDDADSTLGRAVYSAYDAIDTKATAILQHVSIMIAVTGALYSWTATPLLKYVFAVETLVYVSLAVFCLRLLMEQDHSASLSDTENVVAREALLDLTAKLTFLISIFLIGTVIIELVLK